MRIKLIKIGSTLVGFDIKSDKMTFKGYLQYDFNKLILLKSTLSGTININDDACADEFSLDINEAIKFYLHSGVYNYDKNELLEVVECYR